MGVMNFNNSIADDAILNPKKYYFARVPASVSARKDLDHLDVLVWAYLDSFCTFHESRVVTKPMKLNEIAETLGVSRRTLNRSLENLTRARLLDSRNVGHKGKLFQLHTRGIDPNYGSFGKKYGYHIKDTEGFTKVTREMITHGPTPRALRLWMLLERISGKDGENTKRLGWAFALRSEMADWLGVHENTITSDLKELEEFGLLFIDNGSAPGRMNRYKIYTSMSKTKSRRNRSRKAKAESLQRFEEKRAKERAKADAANLKRVSSDAPLSKYGEKRAADDMAVYWFSQIGFEWAVRHASRVEHMKSALRIVLRYLTPKDVKKIIDRHLRDNYKTAKPGDLVRILQKFLSDDGKSALRAQIEKVNKIYKLANLDGSDDDYTDIDFIDQSVPDSAFRPEIREVFKEFGDYEDGEEEDSGDEESADEDVSASDVPIETIRS